MRHTIPVEDLLLLLGANAVVLVKEVKKRTLRLLQRRICARLQVAQIREDTLFKLLGVLDRATESLKSERETSYDIRARDVKEIVPALLLDMAKSDTCTVKGAALTIAHRRHIRQSVRGTCGCTGPAASPLELK